MARKIFVGNYKGGVGKTTFTYNMGCILRAQKKKVLLIDLDPQSSLSEICCANMEEDYFKNLNDGETFNEIIDIYYRANLRNIDDRLEIDIKKFIKDNGNVKFIVSSHLYKDGGLDIKCLTMKKLSSNVLIINRFIKDTGLDRKFDYIIFDCPPSNNIITQSAFLACDYYVIPTIMDAVSIKGVDHYHEIINQYYDRYIKEDKRLSNAEIGNKPKLLGVFEAKKKSKIIDTSKYVNILKSKNFYLFNNIIYDYKDISESLEKGVPSDREEFKNLTKEIVDRINIIEGR